MLNSLLLISYNNNNNRDNGKKSIYSNTFISPESCVVCLLHSYDKKISLIIAADETHRKKRTRRWSEQKREQELLHMLTLFFRWGWKMWKIEQNWIWTRTLGGENRKKKLNQICRINLSGRSERRADNTHSSTQVVRKRGKENKWKVLLNQQRDNKQVNK